MKAISFSLYGTEQAYAVGMLRNAALAPSVYPGWQVVVHVSHQYVHQDVVEALRALPQVTLIVRREPESVKSLFWRIETAFLGKYERMIVRDSDSRLNAREAAAVAEWEVSGKVLHVMHDHVQHNIPVMGGVWGLHIAAAPVKTIEEEFDTWIRHMRAGTYPSGVKQYVRRQSDQNFLSTVVWDLLSKDAMVHDGRKKPAEGSLPFTVKLPRGQFIGQPCGADDKPLPRTIRKRTWHAA